MKRIGIVGARTYSNRRKIKEFVYKLKQHFGDKVEIISGGQPKGADGYAKQNDYGKKYHITNFFDRNKQIAEYSDYIVAFIPSNYNSNGTLDTIKHAQKLEKKVVILD